MEVECGDVFFLTFRSEFSINNDRRDDCEMATYEFKYLIEAENVLSGFSKQNDLYVKLSWELSIGVFYNPVTASSPQQNISEGSLSSNMLYFYIYRRLPRGPLLCPLVAPASPRLCWSSPP